jgi:hypothetical protein
MGRVGGHEDSFTFIPSFIHSFIRPSVVVVQRKERKRAGH